MAFLSKISSQNTGTTRRTSAYTQNFAFSVRTSCILNFFFFCMPCIGGSHHISYVMEESGRASGLFLSSPLEKCAHRLGLFVDRSESANRGL